jgi:DNA-directed RNA polymerase subunit RPC12/RpoP
VSKRTETKTVYVCDLCGAEIARDAYYDTFTLRTDVEIDCDPDASAEVDYHGVRIVVSGPFSAVKRVVDECRKE